MWAMIEKLRMYFMSRNRKKTDTWAAKARKCTGFFRFPESPRR